MYTAPLYAAVAIYGLVTSSVIKALAGIKSELALSPPWEQQCQAVPVLKQPSAWPHAARTCCKFTKYNLRQLLDVHGAVD